MTSLIVILITIAVAVIGSLFTQQSLKTWYRKISRPSWTPPGRVIGLVWTILYILAATSAIIILHKAMPSSTHALIVAIFILNAIVNTSWSYVFFYRHKIRAAIWVSLFLDVTVVVLIELIAPFSTLAAWFLVPYAAWVTFASYLNYKIWTMNK